MAHPALLVALNAYLDEPDEGWDAIDLWESVVHLASTCRELRQNTENQRRRAAVRWCDATRLAVRSCFDYLTVYQPNHMSFNAAVKAVKAISEISSTCRHCELGDPIEAATWALPELIRLRERLDDMCSVANPFDRMLVAMAHRVIHHHLRFRNL